MCARLITPDFCILKKGDFLKTIAPDGSVAHAQWDGFARSENIEQWRADKALEVSVAVLSFSKTKRGFGRVWFELPEGQRALAGILLNNSGRSHFKLLTRQATPPEWREYECSRMPVVLSELDWGRQSGSLELSLRPPAR
jgi:hypothetical protein